MFLKIDSDHLEASSLRCLGGRPLWAMVIHDKLSKLKAMVIHGKVSKLNCKAMGKHVCIS